MAKRQWKKPCSSCHKAFFSWFQVIWKSNIEYLIHHYKKWAVKFQTKNLQIWHTRITYDILSSESWWLYNIWRTYEKCDKENILRNQASKYSLSQFLLSRLLLKIPLQFELIVDWHNAHSSFMIWPSFFVSFFTWITSA